MAPAPAAAPTFPADLLGRLRAAVGRDGVITDPERLLAYESDGLTTYRHLPGAVVLPRDTDETAAVLAALHEEGVAVVPRGAGTGLSGGALALDGAVVVGTARMGRILGLDPANRRARVQAGVINARLSAVARPHGLHYAPDPSSQSACTLGGNVAENSGGPHCLKLGVTSRYVRGLTLVLPDGEVAELGDASRQASGYDLVGLTVGSEGCFGIVTEIEVALVPVPEDVRTLLAIFGEIEDAGRAVTRIIASGLLPAALEIIDGETIRAVEASVFAAGYPVDAGAALVVEFDGTGAGLDDEADAAESCCLGEGAREVRRARSEAERAALWKGRKKAFGAMGRVAPDLMVQDATVPRSRLPEVLGRIRSIADRYELTVANVFHAGDGNLHPNILFDRREPETVRVVERASREIMEACVAAGGTITGEHGVGLDKRDYMSLVHGPDELAAMAAVKQVFDPSGRFNPGKVLPGGVTPFGLDGSGGARRRGRGGEAAAPAVRPAPELRAFVERILGPEGLLPREEPEEGGVHRSREAPEGTDALGFGGAPVVAIPSGAEEAAELLGAATSEGIVVVPAGRGAWLRALRDGPPAGLVVSARRMDRIVEYEPADLTLTAGAGVTLDEVASATGAHDQWLPLDPPGRGTGTLGATAATASAGLLRTRYGSARDLVLGLTLVTGDGRLLRLGGRVVKNVAGFDLVRLAVGSRGTLGLVTGLTVRLFPRPMAAVRLEARAERMEELADAALALAGSNVAPAALELREAPRVQGDREALLAVTLHGPEASVRSEAVGLGKLAPELSEVAGHPPAPEEGGEEELAVALHAPPGALRALIGAVRALVPSEGGAGRGGASAAVRVDVLAGRARVVVPGAGSGGGSKDRWTARLEALGRGVGGDAGFLVETAPWSLDAAARGRRMPRGVEARLLRDLRDRFDPGRILAPGMFEF